ncbi:MAG: hypothetical protein ACK5P5_02345 [Pseudobdellovibrionaceae bacterium]
MKSMSSFIIALVTALSFISSASASETVKGAKKDYQSFKEEMSVKLEAAEKNLSELKAKTKEKSTSLKAKTVAELEETRDKLKAELNSLEEKSQSNWSSLKKSFASSMEKFNSKVQKALKD